MRPLTGDEGRPGFRPSAPVFEFLSRAGRGLSFAQKLFFIFSGSSLFWASAGGLFPGLREGPFALYALAGLLVFSALLSAFSRRVRPALLYAVVLLLSLLFAAYRSSPFPYRYGERVELEAKLLSDYRVRRRALQFTARVRGIRARDGSFVRGPGEKILLNVPATGLAVRRGDVIRVSGLFFGLPYERAREYALYLKNGGITAVFEGYGRGMEVVRRQGRYSPVSFATELKTFVCDVSDRLLPWPQGEFARSLFTGNRDDLPRELVDAFIRTGTMHLLAVSGLHFGFITMFFFFLLKFLRLNLQAIEILLIAVTLFYMVFIGDAPSVQRSAIMVLCGIAVFLFDRDRNYFNILAIAFDLLWCLNPLSLFNPGFLLSFTATFALFFVVPLFTPFFKRFMPGFLATSVSMSLGVQVYMWPVLLVYFGSFPYINVLANIPLVPLSGLSLGLELLTLIAYPIYLPIAVIAAEVNTVVITLCLRLVMLFARFTPITVEGFPGFLLPPYFVAVTLGLLVLSKRIAAGRENAAIGEGSLMLGGAGIREGRP